MAANYKHIGHKNSVCGTAEGPIVFDLLFLPIGGLFHLVLVGYDDETWQLYRTSVNIGRCKDPNVDVANFPSSAL